MNQLDNDSRHVERRGRAVVGAHSSAGHAHLPLHPRGTIGGQNGETHCQVR